MTMIDEQLAERIKGLNWPPLMEWRAFAERVRVDRRLDQTRRHPDLQDWSSPDGRYRPSASPAGRRGGMSMTPELRKEKEQSVRVVFDLAVFNVKRRDFATSIDVLTKL